MNATDLDKQGRRYSEEFKFQVMDYRKDHTIEETCLKFNVSRYSINKWRGWVRKNQKVTNQKWYKEHRDKYFSKPENRQRINAWMSNFRKENPEKVKDTDKKGRDKRRFKKLAEYSNRNFFRKGLKDYHLLTAFDLWKIAKKQKLICPFTGFKLTKENMSVDHILPVSKGGSNHPSNIRLIHKWVNLMLGVHSDEDFLVMCRKIVDFDNRKQDNSNKDT